MRNKTNLLGILNLTSDSFSDGGEFLEFSKAKNRVNEMISDGCSCLLYTSPSPRD